jgi:hypothetical protein
MNKPRHRPGRRGSKGLTELAGRAADVHAWVAFSIHRHCAWLLSPFSTASNKPSCIYLKGRFRDVTDELPFETNHPRVKTARPSAAGVRNVKFSIFYVNSKAPSGAHHPWPLQGHTMHTGTPKTHTHARAAKRLENAVYCGAEGRVVPRLCCQNAPRPVFWKTRSGGFLDPDVRTS